MQKFNNILKDCVKNMGFGGVFKNEVDRGAKGIKLFRSSETNQFENKTMVCLQEIKMNIISSNKADLNFKMNFIALLINSSIESSSSEKENMHLLNYITKKTKINKIDWCSYLIKCLVKTKQSFDPSSATSNFNGSSAYLVKTSSEYIEDEDGRKLYEGMSSGILEQKN
uniref:Uncharacterized protein n=1 Tax=Lactuca sativa TaxID=4236 RepID=A0A9R1V1V4_LACSA|nr:hypothetical protein LSAT_V11C700355900 [Lactuca sativa]